MIKLRGYMLVLALAFVLVPAALVLGAVGQDKMQKAQDALDNADMPKALALLDQAIQAMESAGVISGGDNELAKAYYLKANIQLARGGSTAALEQLLSKAVQAAPNYTPDREFITDPRIVPIYAKVLAKHNEQGQSAVRMAQDLYKSEKYCEVVSLLQPFQNAFGDQRLLGERIYSMAMGKCSSPVDSEKIKTKLASVAVLGERRCGLLPVIVKDLPSYGDISHEVSDSMLAQSMEVLTSEMRMVSVGADTLDRWRRAHGLSRLEDLTVQPGLVKFGWSIADIFKGKASGFDAAVGALPQRYEAALAYLMEQERLQYILLVLVAAVEPQGSTGVAKTPDLNILVNLYAAPSVREPLVTMQWRGLSGQSAKDKFSRIGTELGAQLRKKR